MTQIPKPRYKLSPELTDGDHWIPVDTKASVLEAVAQWCDEFGTDLGCSFTVEVVFMTDEEIAALPEI